MDNDDEQNANNDEGAGLQEEEIALRRNHLLMFGVVLLAILSICLAVALPDDLELNSPAIPSPINVVEVEPPTPPKQIVTNTTNISGKGAFRDAKDSVEVMILRNIATHNAIQNFKEPQPDSQQSATSPDPQTDADDIIHKILQKFMDTEEFEDFIIDIEITDAIKRLRQEKGYQKRGSKEFEGLFKQIETHFLGDDSTHVQLVRRVGQELEKVARQTISERNKMVSSPIRSQEKQFIAHEIYEDMEVRENGSGDMIDD